MKTLQERFDEKHILDMSGCWLWIAAVCSGGYGCIGESKTRRVLQAHRVSWELHCGPIPEGKWVLHKCDVRRCVNPEHLFLGTVKDNGADMAAKGRSNRGQKWKQKNPGIGFAVKGSDHHNSKLLESDVVEIIKSEEKGIVLASKFGVSKSVISQIQNRKRWKHVEVH